MLERSIIQTISHPIFTKQQLIVKIKRDDLIHPIISGNKWRKLQGNLQHAKTNNYQGILSFGGGYSNHIHALAFACYQQKIPSIAIIRGEAHYQSNFTLSWARHWGMLLIFVDRKTYRRRTDSDYLTELQQEFPNYFIVPEGGSNQLALSGVGETIDELNQQTEFDSLMLPVGSGGTLAGLVKADKGQHNILGIAVLKQGEYLREAVTDLLPNKVINYQNWQILTDFHRGGYAKFSTADSERLRLFSHQVGIPFEPIYSGKMILALLDLVEQNFFPKNHTLMLLHTGGLQGLVGLAEQGRINTGEWLLPDNYTDLPI